MCFTAQLGQYAGVSGKLIVYGALRFMTDTTMLLAATLPSTATCQLLERYFYLWQTTQTGLEMARNHPATHPNSLVMANITILTKAAACLVQSRATRLSTQHFPAPGNARSAQKQSDAALRGSPRRCVIRAPFGDPALHTRCRARRVYLDETLKSSPRRQAPP